MAYFLSALAGYLLGSVNPAYFIAKIKNTDIRNHGSGNLGASNATALFGWKIGVAIALNDIIKALAAVYLAKWLFPDTVYVGAVAGIAAVLGHIFPFYLGFKGGKGFASFIGMTIGLNWKLALVIAIAIILITYITDYIVFGTLTTIISVPICLAIINRSIVVFLIIGIGSAVIVYKHWENYVRIYHGTEIGLKSVIRGEHRIQE